MKYVIFLSLLVSLVCRVTAFYNIALGKNVSISIMPRYTAIDTWNLTDGDNTNTCASFTGHFFTFSVDLGQNYSIKSSAFVLKENYPGSTTMNCYADGSKWPFYLRKTLVKDSSQKIEFDVQQSGERISFTFWEKVRNTVEFELCEIEIYGCEPDYFGSECQPCIKNDNCVQCDVNNGECYVCKYGYTGPNCSTSTDNLALKTKTFMHQHDGYHYYHQPSYLLVDGDLTQTSCIDFKSYHIGLQYTFGYMFGDTYNIKGVRLYFIHEGCPVGHYGGPCRPCPVHCGQCNAVDGSCMCQPGYKGDNCTEMCPNNTYGFYCVYSCGHCFNESCDHVIGHCVSGCDKGWGTIKCNTACSTGWYGHDCASRCSSNCITPYVCDRFTGSCLGGCATGWTNDTCESVDTEYCVDWAPLHASVAYHNITWREERSGLLVRYDPAVTLVCNFSLKSDEDLFYDVTWFIDGLRVLHQTVDLSSNYTAVIAAHDILGAQKKIGSNVSCNVGAKRKIEDFPCFVKEANPFFAGLKE